MNKIIVLFDIDYTLFQTHLFKKSQQRDFVIYEEIFYLLNALSEFVTLGIFSQGDISFQKKKLKRTNILKFFGKDNIHITKSKEEDLSKIIGAYKKFRVILIDDKYEILKVAKGNFQEVISIWVNRGPYAKKALISSDFKPDFEVKNLSAILSIVKDQISS